MLRRLSHLLLVLTAGLAVTPPAQAAAEPRCAAPAGTVTVPVTSAGTTYPVSVYVPQGYTGRRAVPLVLNLHGSGSNGENQLAISGMRQTADRGGFLVAVPDGGVPQPGTPDGHTWVIPGVPNTSGQFPSPDDRDDVRFLADTIDAVAARLCADESRVYATGFSGGARMASLLACRLPDRIAAVAPVAGLRAGNPGPAGPDPATCAPSRPVPVLAFHGQADTVNPYDGGGAGYWQYSVPAAYGRWAALDGCRGKPRDRELTEHVTLTTSRPCRAGAEVSLYTISDGGHTWPGSPYPDAFPELGKVSYEVNASDVMWRFFTRHPLRPDKAAEGR
ncbi:alpha/beta hydrolase family esterase [Streptomyces sp. 4F14]|uniref:extracellular catalytic domain type 1 short-chain-length polyhydroxyalkanoate depolymerase n=1 Tax=Streptomyces sp. 4F14 TaxID=3394380 RepID=UPI003A88984B